MNVDEFLQAIHDALDSGLDPMEMKDLIDMVVSERDAQDNVDNPGSDT